MGRELRATALKQHWTEDQVTAFLTLLYEHVGASVSAIAAPVAVAVKPALPSTC
jgi:hypothetical protein